MRSFAAFLILSVLSMAPSVNAQQDPFDAVAADAAAAIVKASPKHGSGTNVLVADFSESRGQPTALGSDLARQFFLSLQTHARNFALADRDKYLREFAADKLTPGSYEGAVSLRCYASELHATVVVTGELDDLDDKVVVWIRVIRFEDKETIFDRRVSLPLTPAMEELLKLAPDVLASSNSNRATSDGSPRDEAPTAGKNGYSLPTCFDCPNAGYSGAALKEKVQGTVEMKIRVGTDGLVKDVTIVHGLPCGMNKQALNSIRTWKMRPATGPDGQPAEVTTTAEMSFRLY
jgi:TonB family protein